MNEYSFSRSRSNVSPGRRRVDGRFRIREAPAKPAPTTTTRALRRTPSATG
jgi:hypothetical protein